jgi:hypothetical protein
MKPGYYWYIEANSEDWQIVLVTDARYVWFVGSEIESSVEELKGNGEFGPRIPQKAKRVGSIAEITSQRKSAKFR